MSKHLSKIFVLIVLSFFTAHLAFAQDLSHLDPKKVVPARALSQAVAYLKKYSSDFKNQSYITVIDFTKHSSKKRFFLVNLKTGAVESFLTAHGAGSDPNADGYATKFSNSGGTHASSLGFYRTLSTYSGGHGYSLLLQGLSSTNSSAYDRAIVVHGADYVKESTPRAGRSWGCPAVDMKYRTYIIDRIKSGSLMYAWFGQ